MGQPAPSRRSPWLALIVLCAGQMMIVIDQNIVNVALPTIQHSLGFSDANLVWVVNAYVIAFGGLLLLAGRLGDLIGRKKVFVAGIIMFSAASLLCGFAASEVMLIASRFVQGVGGAVASACILGMVATMFSEPRKRAQAIGAYSFAAAGGGAVGPLLGGVLTGLVSWNWIFFINVPLGAVVVVLALRSVQTDPGLGLSKGADFVGTVLLTSGLMLGVYTIVNTEAAGWRSARTLLLGSLAAALLIGFVVREATAVRPLLPLRIFRSRSLTGANIVQFFTIAGMFGLLFFGTLYVQRVLGLSPLQAGLGFVPIALVIAVVSLGLSPRLVVRFGQRSILCVGLFFIVAAFVMLTFTRVDGTYVVDFLPAGIVMGMGFGLAAPATMGLGMAAVAPSDSGIASGLINTTQQIGGAVGLAVLTAFATPRANSLMASGQREIAALTSGYHLAFMIAAGFAIVALVTTVVMAPARLSEETTQPPGDDSNERNATVS